MMKNPEDRRFRFAAALIIAALTAGPQAVAGLPRRPAGQSAALPSLEEMETNLLSAVNKARASRSLPVLRSAPALVRLARRHSAEMARLNVLSHESASGKFFTDRLTDAAVTFAANGENVALSGTYDAGRIHQSFMESPGHRENVLNPEFDEVGIGIVRGAANTYYVTEDFIRSLVRIPDSEVRAVVLGILNEARARVGRLPVVEVDEIRGTAEVFARNRAAGKASPPIPSFFGPALMRMVIAPDLDRISEAIKVKSLERYGRAGIGVEFNRTREYPGGAYFVCALLVEDSSSSGPDDLDRLLAVLNAVNTVRTRLDLRRLELDQELSRQADLLISRRRNEGAASPSVQMGGKAFFSMFQKLDRIDDALRKGLREAGLRKIGISTLRIQAEDGQLLQYAVAVILSR